MPVVPCSAAVWMLPGMILLVFTKASTLNVKFSLGLPFGVLFGSSKMAVHCTFSWFQLCFCTCTQLLISASSPFLLCCALLQPYCAYQLYFWHYCTPWILSIDSSTDWCSKETTPLCYKYSPMWFFSLVNLWPQYTHSKLESSNDFRPFLLDYTTALW